MSTRPLLPGLVNRGGEGVGLFLPLARQNVGVEIGGSGDTPMPQAAGHLKEAFVGSKEDRRVTVPERMEFLLAKPTLKGQRPES